jgi:hypothetical protein
MSPSELFFKAAQHPACRKFERLIIAIEGPHHTEFDLNGLETILASSPEPFTVDLDPRIIPADQHAILVSKYPTKVRPNGRTAGLD